MTTTPIEPLRWQDGARSAQEGTDLAAVAKGLTGEQLGYWLATFGDRLWHESRILAAEQERRGGDYGAGPLFREESC